MVHFFPLQVFYKGWIQFIKEEIGTLLILNSIVFAPCLMQQILSPFRALFCLIFISLLRKYFAGGFCCNNVILHNQYIIITGANSGIGKETAIELASRGAKLILACRDVKKAEEVAKFIREKYHSQVLVEKLDLASFESIKSFASTISQNYKEIHCLINNAGIMMCPYMETKDGLEIQMGVNHFGPFLLTLLLLPLLRNSPKARIINLSSMAHYSGRIPFDDFKYKRGYSSIKAYGNSKLANILHLRHLAKLLQGTNVQVFALHPGAVQTELGRHLPFGLDFVYSKLLSFFSKSAKEGAQTTVYCVTEAVQQPMIYFSDCLPDKPSKAALNDDDAEKLWKISEEVVNLSYSLKQ